MKERELYDGCLAGDRTAQKELYENTAPSMLGVCLRYLGNRADAEDVMQDAYIRIFSSLNKFHYRGDGSLSAWMSRIMVNFSIDFLRKKNRLQAGLPVVEGALPEVGEEPEPSSVRSIPAEVLMDMVASLPDGYRTVFNLVAVERMRHREVAGMLGISVGTSTSRYQRARHMLARMIESYEKSTE